MVMIYEIYHTWHFPSWLPSGSRVAQGRTAEESGASKGMRKPVALHSTPV